MYELTAEDKAEIILKLGDLRDDRGYRAARAAAQGDYGMASWWENEAQQIQRLMFRIEESI